jgi:hypothetical protein
MRRALFFCLLLTSLSVAHAAAPPHQWLPWESWPGGRQYDARLDRPVTLWVTGTPLAQVFAAIEQQTGVEIGFFPADDDNTRICANLYLNPKQPPTLRDLLAQLSWVLDCSFGFTGEGEARTYVLLSTSMGAKVMEQLGKEAAQRAYGGEADRERLLRERLATARARLAEIRGAFDLSREDAIRKYRGVDDQVLLALVDPARRALARYLLSLSAPAWERPTPQYGLLTENEWPRCSPEQQAWLWTAMQPALAEAAAGRGDLPDIGIDWTDRRAVEGLRPEVDVMFDEFGAGAFTVTLGVTTRWDDEGNPSESQGFTVLDLWLATDSSANPNIEIELRKALGQPMTPEEAQRFTDEMDRRAQRQANRRWLEEQFTDLVRLSPEAAARLNETTLPVKLDEPHALWQIEELVAARTGMHVVSDAFWQPARSVQMALEAIPPARADAPTGLEALRLSCAALTPGDSAPPRVWLRAVDWRRPDDEFARWEWGDAGNFLRFRSPERDVWRGALLPLQAADATDAWLAPHLPEDLEQATERPAVTVPIDPRQLARLAAGLTEPQRRWGGMLTYGDPTETREQYQYAMRDALLGAVTVARHAFQLLAVMSDEQWERLGEDGLRWGDDISITPPTPGPDRFYWEQFAKGDRIAFAETDPHDLRAAALPPGTSTSWRWLAFARRVGRETDYQQLPFDLVVRPKPLQHLVPPQ